MRLLIPALLAACVHRPRDTGALLDGATLIAHRGGAALAPENTWPAFEHARALGLPIELDVTLAATGEVVVMHDDTLDRTTDGSGPVDETPWPVIATLDAGSWFAPRYAGTRVPLLVDVLREFAPDVVIDVEIKSPRAGGPLTPERLAAAVVDAIHEAGAADRVLVTSFNPLVLAAVRARDPALPRGQIYGTLRDSDVSPLTRFVLRHRLLDGKSRPDVLVAESVVLTPRRVRRFKRRGYRVLAWTVDDPDAIRRLHAMGVDAVITNLGATAPGQ